MCLVHVEHIGVFFHRRLEVVGKLKGACGVAEYDDIGGLHPVVEHTRMYGYSLNHRTGEVFCNLQRGGVVVHQCDACPGGGSCLGGRL